MSFTTAEILAEVSGNKANYTIKDITNFNTNIVELTPAKALKFKDVAGSFTATIILQHSTKADVTIANCEFEISKTAPPSPALTFTKRTKLFVSGGSFTTVEILAGVQGTKTNYTIKDITNFNTNIVTLTPAKALNFKSVAGSFNATIILEQHSKTRRYHCKL